MSQIDNLMIRSETLRRDPAIIVPRRSGSPPLSAFSVKSKLTAKQIERIKALLARRTCSQGDIAKRFGVSPYTISNINTGKKTK